MAPTRPNRRNNSTSNNSNSSSKGDSTIRTSKRKAGESADPNPLPELAPPSPRGGGKNAKKIKEATNDAPLLPPPPPPQEDEEEEEILEDSQEDKEKRQRAIELLRSADDLPSAYAALKLVKEIIGPGSDGARRMAKRIARLLSPADQVLIDQASLAVPYLMYKLCVEEFTQPRAQGGLAYSHAKAVVMASILFEKAGPACCCAANITELQLVKKCSGNNGKEKNNTTVIITKNDARKVLPILKKIGIIARSKIDETIAKLERAPPETKVSEEEPPQQEEPQTSNEAKAKDITTEEELPQQEVATQEAEGTKIADDEAPQSYDL